ncbi:MAG: hypothetical protein RL226_2332 [Bacteroidota bacterium]|jgi:hypothetical protein
MKRLGVLLAFLITASAGWAQGLENVVVETYYVSDSNDATDTDGGELVEGSVVYRIFIDMAAGYELQAVYGNNAHPLLVNTTTYFFNNEDRGEVTGDAINDIRLDENTVAVDSWITLGAASDAHFGIPKNADTDGSIVGGANNDGGSEGVAAGLLSNEDPMAGIPLTTADGLIPAILPSSVVTLGMDVSMLGDVNAPGPFTTSSGAWSVLEGVQGATADNIVLIAQFTTHGDLSFQLNVQLGTPSGGTENYVYSNPQGGEFFFAGLNYPIVSISGCTESSACNYNPLATNDDGSCLTPVPNCLECLGGELVLIDSDFDGICNAEELTGCTSDTACNFNPDASEDDGTCIQPVSGCTICNTEGNGLELIDADGDGVCDADEISGCLNPDACNYVANATDEVPCIIPIPNCIECNVLGTGLVLVDSDGDGICDAEDTNVCQGDIDGDGYVASGDLLLLLANFGCTNNCSADIDFDGSVGASDFLLLLSLYGSQCP